MLWGATRRECQNVCGLSTVMGWFGVGISVLLGFRFTKQVHYQRDLDLNSRQTHRCIEQLVAVRMAK